MSCSFLWSFCCSCEPTLEDDLNDVRAQDQCLLPQMTPVLQYAARENWVLIVFMMSLDLKAHLNAWLQQRITNVERNTAKSAPSFELLAVALWLSNEAYLQELAAAQGQDLIQYLASRNAEQDMLGNSLWHFARVGMAPTFIAAARAAKLIPHTNLPAKISPPLQDVNTMRLFATVHSGNPVAIGQAIRFHVRTTGTPGYYDLALSGCWHGLLILIILKHCDPHEQPVLTLLANKFPTDFFKHAQEYWDRLRRMQRLEEHVANPESLAVCYTYIVFRYQQQADAFAVTKKIGHGLNASVYVNCMNLLLEHCDWQQPQPVLLELLCFSPGILLQQLTAANRAAIVQQLQTLYPHYVQYFQAAQPESAQQQQVQQQGEITVTERIVVRAEGSSSGSQFKL